MPSATAISSNDRPPKKCSSTIATLRGIEHGQLGQRVVERHQRRRPLVAQPQGFAQGHRLAAAAAFGRQGLARVVDQDLAHGARREGHEMPAVAPVDLGGGAQAAGRPRAPRRWAGGRCRAIRPARNGPPSRGALHRRAAEARRPLSTWSLLSPTAGLPQPRRTRNGNRSRPMEQISDIVAEQNRRAPAIGRRKSLRAPARLPRKFRRDELRQQNHLLQDRVGSARTPAAPGVGAGGGRGLGKARRWRGGRRGCRTMRCCTR